MMILYAPQKTEVIIFPANKIAFAFFWVDSLQFSTARTFIRILEYSDEPRFCP